MATKTDAETAATSIHDAERQSPEQAVCPAHTTEARLLTKIDMRVLPFLCIMYLLAFLDRVNIANAKLFGLAEDLHLGTGDKYNTALVIFFVPYCLLEIPSNVLLKKLSPHLWLSLNMFLFGLTTMMQGLTKSYGGLLAARFFLGVFETGMFPGAFYLIGMWYRRSEAQKRYSFFFSSTTLAGAFGGLLAAAIGKMDGLRGMRGWRWIFLIEGGLTVLVALGFFFLLPDFPEEAAWLRDDEREYVSARLRVDQRLASGRERRVGLRDVARILEDFKVVVAGFMYFGLIVTAYGYAYFAPTIIQTFHYSPVETQLRSVPPWAVAFGCSLLLAYLSDRLRHRFLFAVVPMCVVVVAYAVLLAVHDNRHVQYAMLFLITSGSFSAMPIIVCWFNMNLGGHVRRSIGSAWQVGFGNLGGIIAVYIFLARDSPRFTKGYSVSLAFTLVAIVSTVLYAWGCWRANRSRDAAVEGEKLSEEEKQDLGDLAPDYRYLL